MSGSIQAEQAMHPGSTRVLTERNRSASSNSGAERDGVSESAIVSRTMQRPVALMIPPAILIAQRSYRPGTGRLTRVPCVLRSPWEFDLPGHTEDARNAGGRHDLRLLLAPGSPETEHG